jgi:hypothetical protein
VTAKRAAPAGGLDGLPGTLADIVCWLVFYLQRSSEEEIDTTVAHELLDVIAASLRLLPVWDRIDFLQHAASRAATSQVTDYQEFLLELAEDLGIE